MRGAIGFFFSPFKALLLSDLLLFNNFELPLGPSLFFYSSMLLKFFFSSYPAFSF